MPPGEIATLLTALRDDLVTNAFSGVTLKTLAGRIPRAVTPTDCPMLAVAWTADEGSEVMSTQQVSVPLGIDIRYYEEAVQDAQTLIDNETKALALVDAADKIFNRLMTLWNAGAFGGAWQIRPNVGVRARSLFFGLVEGVSVGAVADRIYGT